jgi:hypothetical protein
LDGAGIGAAVREVLTSLKLTALLEATGAVLVGSGSGSTTLQAAATASGTLTLPAATDTLVGRNTTDTLTNKSIPVVSGGTTASDTLTLRSTSGAGFTDAIIFQTGTQVEAARIDTARRWGIGTTTPANTLHVVGVVQIDQVGGEANLYMGVGTAGNSGRIAYDNNNTRFRVFLGGTEVCRFNLTGNVKIGGTADRATTEGTNQVVIFDGTAPVGTLANGCSFYSTAGEMRVMDAAGNATLLSPHDKTTNEWIYDSAHTPTGKRLKINVEKLLRFVNDHFGLDCVQDLIEE